MKPVEEFHRINDCLGVWQGYNPAVKVDCTSTALRSAEGWIFIDPILLDGNALTELLGGEKCAGIVLSSGNHQRASLDFRAALGVRIFAPVTAREELVADEWFGDSVLGLTAIPLPGGALGETGFQFDDTVIVGDAVIHLGELMLLPDKYCADARLLRHSLAVLAEREFANLCFAHGLPIIGSGREKLAALL